MDTIEKTPRKLSALLRVFRSSFGSAVIGLILIFVISSSIRWQAFAEYQKEELIARKIIDAGGIAARSGMLPTGWNSLYPFRSTRPIVLIHLDHCKNPSGLIEDINKLRHLEELYLTNSDVADADLKHLRGLNKLESLSLYGTQVSDAGLEILRELTRLHQLNLSHTQISDAGLEHLKGMSISELDLGATVVPEVGLEHLKGMPELKRLSFSVTPDNKGEVQKSLPCCTISP